jgi:environmental stress-induced protein Ves
MKVLRANQHRAMPWKNGGGVTYEIASFPARDTVLDGFEWRVSMALVETDGPFSLFPGIDRSLAIMDGAGLRLAIDGAPEFTVASGSEPHFFAADVPTSSRLIAGAVTDLNVMTRRGAWRHRVTRIDVGGSTNVDSIADVTMLIVRSGSITLPRGTSRETLGLKDAVLLDAAVTLESRTAAEVFRIDLWRSKQAL